MARYYWARSCDAGQVLGKMDNAGRRLALLGKMWRCRVRSGRMMGEVCETGKGPTGLEWSELSEVVLGGNENRKFLGKLWGES